MPRTESVYTPAQAEQLGQTVERLRIEAGFGVAARFAAHIGLTPPMLSRIETGERAPTWPQAVAIADGLGLSLEDLHAVADIQLGRFPSSRDAASTGQIAQPVETTEEIPQLTELPPLAGPITRADLEAAVVSIEAKVHEAVTPLVREVQRLLKVLRATEGSDAQTGTPTAEARKVAGGRGRTARPAVRAGSRSGPLPPETGEETVRKAARAAARRDAGHDPEVASEGQGGA